MPSILTQGNGLVFSQVLAVDTATIDTLANGVPLGPNILDVYFVGRTDETAALSSVAVYFNGDSGSNYDRSQILNTNASVTGGANLATASAVSFGCAAGSDTANVASACRITVPAYAATTFFKAGTAQFGLADETAANGRSNATQFSWRNTAAINQVTFAITSGSGQKFKAGSALYVYIR